MLRFQTGLITAFGLLTALGAIGGDALAQSASEPGGSKAPIKSVVELFTSQGCSSCPAADKLLENTYIRRDGVLALSFNVDYWDYIGWKDTLASPKFTKRQRQYASTRGDGQVYTPQTVINGVVHAVGSDRSAIEAALTRSSSATAANWVSVDLKSDGQNVVVNCAGNADAGKAKDATLWLAQVTRKITVPVARGENAGRTITYHNVVRDLMPIGMWNGQPLTVRLDRRSVQTSDTEFLAVLLQQGPAGPIIGAATLAAK